MNTLHGAFLLFKSPRKYCVLIIILIGLLVYTDQAATSHTGKKDLEPRCCGAATYLLHTCVYSSTTQNSPVHSLLLLLLTVCSS